MAIIRKIPWKIQPPNRVAQFSNTGLGQHCVWAAVPGWDQYYADSSDNIEGHLTSIGQVMTFDMVQSGATASGGAAKVADNYGGGIGSARVARLNHPVSDGFLFLRNQADLGIKFQDSQKLTIVAIVKLIGDGRPPGGTSDPRIFSKDEGAGANDHDLMIGIADAGNAVRARIRIGSSTQTVLGPAAGVQDDEVQLIAATVQPASSTNSIVMVHHLTKDGVYATETSGSVTGTYNPRTTTSMAIGGNAEAVGNQFEGDVIAVYAFDAVFTESMFRDLFNDPWQVFAPRTILLPTFVSAGGPTAHFKSFTPSGLGTLSSSKTIAVTYSGGMSATGTSAFLRSITKRLSIANSASASLAFSRAVTFRRGFSLSGTATPTKQRAIAVGKELAGTGFPEQSNDFGVNVIATPSGVGSSTLSSTTIYAKVTNYVASAAVTIGKHIGKGFQIVGRGVQTLTGNGIESPSGRGILRLLVRLVVRDKTRDTN